MRLILLLCCLSTLTIPVSALEIQAPEVPHSAEQWMPEDTHSFSDGVLCIVRSVLDSLIPEFRDAAKTATSLTAILIIFSVGDLLHASRKSMQIAGAVSIALILLDTSGSMIDLGVQTVRQISDYGRMLLPVMTAAMAAQGGLTSSGAIYAGTAMVDAVLGNILTSLLIPGIWIYLTLCTGGAALGEDQLKRISDLIKGIILWLLKGILAIFTTYLAITGVVSGTTDAAALKATKVTISTVVPMVGSVLSDASEAVLVSTALVKNAAGVYGILAVLAIFLHPFGRIGLNYLVLKLISMACAVFGKKELTSLVADYSCAMGLLLAMTGTECMMMLISTVCFMRGMI